jgi:GWxTD domain-containing protein
MKTIALIAILLMLSGSGWSKESKDKKKSADPNLEVVNIALAPQYITWQRMTMYIATSEEKKVFSRLTSDRDRDIFINIFWQQRDPTPGTPENEYQKEIEARFAHVNEFFRRGSPRPGWMTDMGRIYMILGKPNSVSAFENVVGLYPATVWYYYGEGKTNLPTYYNIVFFKPFGAGEWKLYDPVSDGPRSLIVNTSGVSQDDYYQMYTTIEEMAPDLAGPLVSMIPGEIPYNYAPNPMANLVMANIIESPLKKINVSYATNFLKYKGNVSVESSINYIESSNTVALVRNERYNYNFVNFSIKPKKVSIDFNETKDQYYTNYRLSVSLRQNDAIVFQYVKNFAIDIDQKMEQNLTSCGIVLHDYFPIIPGKYQLVVFIENSVGKEFTYYDREINVPAEPGSPVLATPVLGYQTEENRSPFYSPYKFQDKKLVIDTDKVFSGSEIPIILIGVYHANPALWEKGKVEWTLRGMSEKNPFGKSGTILLKDSTFQKDSNFLQPLTDGGLKPDYYEATLKLYNSAGNLLNTQSAEFTVSPSMKLARPIGIFKQMLDESIYYFEYQLGQQYEGIKNFEQAELHYVKSLESKPDYSDALLAYLRIENSLKKFTVALTEAERLKGDEKLAFEYHAVRGTALFGLEKYEEAQAEFLKANKIYNSDTGVINQLGFTFLKLNNPEQALESFSASLRLNRDQPLIEKALADVRKKMPPEAEKK